MFEQLRKNFHLNPPPGIKSTASYPQPSYPKFRYLGVVGAREAWVVDPFTKLRFSVLKETVDIQLRGGFGVSQSYEELLEMLTARRR